MLEILIKEAKQRDKKNNSKSNYKRKNNKEDSTNDSSSKDQVMDDVSTADINDNGDNDKKDDSEQELERFWEKNKHSGCTAKKGWLVFKGHALVMTKVDVSSNNPWGMYNYYRMQVGV